MNNQLFKVYVQTDDKNHELYTSAETFGQAEDKIEKKCRVLFQKEFLIVKIETIAAEYYHRILYIS